MSGRPPGTVQGWARAGVTTAFVAMPFAGLAAAVWLAWGHGLNLADVLLALAFYVITGLGVTVGFHRLLTHRSFTAVPALRVALAIAGSMSFQGEVIGWVAIHRRHHAFTDRPGDPHSPYRYGSNVADPACARHGADRGQVDISAAVIRIFERLGWATKVRWPTPARLDSRRRCPGRGEPEPVLRPGGQRIGRAAASRLSSLPARGDRVQ